MKKLFNKVVGGLYLCSVVLGIAMALTVSMAACDMWDYRYDQYAVAERSVKREYPSGGFIENHVVYDADADAINYDTGVFYLKGDEATEDAWTSLKKRYDRLWRTWSYLPLADLWDYTNVYYHFVDGSRYFVQYGEFGLVAAASITVVLSVLIMEGKSANKVWRQKMLQAFGVAMVLVLIEITRRCTLQRACGELSTTAILIPVMLLVIPLLILKKTWLPKEARLATEAKTDDKTRKSMKRLMWRRKVGSVESGVPMEVVVPHGGSNDSNLYDS